MRRRTESILLSLLALLALLGADLAMGQARPTPPPPTTPPLSFLVAPFYLQLAQLRGIAGPGPAPPMQTKSRDDMRRFIEQELDRRYSPARIDREKKGMAAWGLIPRDYDLRKLFVDLMEEQVAAYYDPRAKVMVVGDWLPTEAQQASLLHELVHALQDHETSLEAFLAPRAGQGDQLLARQGLVEGEAVALMIDLLLQAQGSSLTALPDLSQVRASVAAGTTGPVISAAPKFLKDLLVFPYLDGLEFVYQFRKANPWSSLTALYQDPPRSTSQIMHPAKRLGPREDPVAVSLPDLGALGPGITAVSEDELGEFGLGSVLGLSMGEAAGRAAAEGWRGDRYRIWEDGDGFVIAYLVTLESPRLAEAFAANYARVMEQRHTALAGKRVAAPDGALVTWQDGGRSFAVDRRGADVLVLERMPAATADHARESIWRSRGQAAAKP